MPESMPEAAPETHTDSPAPATPGPRPSRQELVVPPQRSNRSVVIGACLCAAAGFGLVWGLGLGRGRSGSDDQQLQPPTMARADDPAESLRPSADTSAAARQEPDLLPPADEAIPVRPTTPTGRWNNRPAAHETPPADPDGHDDRYGVRPTSLDAPDAVLPASGDVAAPRPLPRFAAADLMPVPDAVTPVAADMPVDPAPETPPAEAVPGAAGASSPDLAPPLLQAPPPADPALPAGGPTPPTADTAAPAAHAPSAAALPEDTGDLAAPQATAPPAAAALPLVPQAPPSPPVAAAFGAAPPPFAGSVPPGPPSAPLPLPPAFIAPPAARPVTTAPAAPPPVAATSASAGSPFAAAPALTPGGIGSADPDHPPAAGTAAKQPPALGQGRPGPMQLEGVQTPQVSVEKRGPREVSVGKPARYEIVVRNVGSATAHDVLLRDAVPQGTALVATTPPASPVTQASGDADGALVWALGTLPPGGQATVTMEVMPQVEGEVGSVASVSFRTDASVRSRATKPDLRIECTPPEPVLIGRDLQVTVTVTNPGTGVATGVVLEGFLPDNVSHRSGRELEFDVGQLRPGESRTIDLVLGTRGPGLHAARLAARADGGVEVVHELPIEVTAPTLELAIDMPVRRFLQRPATCTVTMSNAGTAPARAIELAAQLPPGMKFVKANNAGWHDDRTHRVLWNLEELPAGETGSVQMVVMPVELGPQKLLAAARSADGLADQVTHTCDVEGLAALSFDVVDSEDPIEVDGVTEYVVRVGNQGTKPATGVRLTATLLGDLEPLEARGPGGHRVDNLTIAFEPLAKLAPAEEAVFRIRAKGRRAGDQRIQVQLTSADQPAPITKEEITRVYADR
jgi:uncharacterized repeat protein (TIGR01451 family)